MQHDRSVVKLYKETVVRTSFSLRQVHGERLHRQPSWLQISISVKMSFLISEGRHGRDLFVEHDIR